jgi:hypothetical protein
MQQTPGQTQPKPVGSQPVLHALLEAEYLLGHLTTYLFMTTSPAQKARGYRLSFIINTAVGVFLMLLAAIGFMVELSFPSMRGSGLAFGFLPAALICFSIGIIHRQKYLSLSR